MKQGLSDVLAKCDECGSEIRRDFGDSFGSPTCQNKQCGKTFNGAEIKQLKVAYEIEKIKESAGESYALPKPLLDT